MPVDFRGKQYFQVSERVAAFRTQHPADSGWGITTEIFAIDDAVVVFCAKVLDADGRVIATGYAEEVRTKSGVNSTSALENCETSAIGRALAAAGWGGDGEYASADELAAKLDAQANGRTRENSRPRPKPVPVTVEDGPSDKQIGMLKKVMASSAFTDEERLAASVYAEKHPTKKVYSQLIDKALARIEEHKQQDAPAPAEELFA